MDRIEKRRTAAKWILLVLLIYCLITTALTYLVPDSRVVAILCPFTNVAVYLLQWEKEFAPIVAIAHTAVWLFVTLPLAGWVLLCKPIRAGKTLVVAPYCVLLACNLVISASHIISALGNRKADYLGVAVLQCAVSLLISAAVLTAVCIWQPKRI